MQVEIDIGGEVFQPAISPDASLPAFVFQGQLAVRRLDQKKVALLPGTEGAAFPFFSPDGQWIAFFAGGKLRKVSIQGGAPVTLCEAPDGRGGAWSEDGYIVANLSRTGGLFEGCRLWRNAQTVNRFQRGNPVTSHRWPQTLPSGKGLLYISHFSDNAQDYLQFLPSGGKARTLVRNCLTGRYLPGGYLIYYQRGTLFAAPLDLKSMELAGPAIPLVEEVASDSIRGAEFDVSSTGTLVYRRGAAGTNYVISWLDSDGRTEPVFANPGGYWTPRLSPTGARLALTIEPPFSTAVRSAQVGLNLSIRDLTLKAMTQLTFESGLQDYPVWTPDGGFLAFRSAGTLAGVRSDGAGRVERVPAANNNAIPWSFSPDGKWLAFSQDDPQTGSDLWIAPVTRTGGEMRLGKPRSLLTQAGQQSAPAISPDGLWLAYHSDESGQMEVFVVPFSPEAPARSGKRQVSNAGGSWPVWSRHGRELFYRGADWRVMVVDYVTRGDSFGPGMPRAWAEKTAANTGALFSSFDLAPDGKRVLAVFDAENARPETHLSCC